MQEIPFEELLEGLLNNFESEFIEFKDSNANPDNIGELISALANGAVLSDKEEAYLVYGINDDRKIVGTTFNPHKKFHNQVLMNYLRINIKYLNNIILREGYVDEKYLVIFIIPRAILYPVEYKGEAFIRIDSAKKKLREHPDIARELWGKLLTESFEENYASSLIDEQGVFDLLDFSPYFIKQEKAIPNNNKQIIEIMLETGVLVNKIGKYYITNLGAILFAKNLSDFKTLINREVRIIKYSTENKSSVERSLDFTQGYAICIDKILEAIKLLSPTEEYIEGITRKERSIFINNIVRELLPNTLLHQDFCTGGYCPRVEIYKNRIEFSNSGTPVIKPERFLDLNRSRNSGIIRLTRTMHICEERGMGIDNAETACAKNFLPSIKPSASDGITKVIVFGHKTLRQFTKADRINLVYMHCCLQYANQQNLTNESLRSRFPNGVMSPTVSSRWISEAVKEGFIVRFDQSSSRKNTSYIPIWAK